MNRLWNVLKRLARSAGAGAFATLADLGVLALLTSGVRLGPRVASIPAFTVGAIVMYFGQKYFAFGERGKVRRAQVVLFAVVQFVGLALNAALFEGVMRFVPSTRPFYLPVRLVTTNLVWLAYSFPVWHLVFRDRS